MARRSNEAGNLCKGTSKRRIKSELMRLISLRRSYLLRGPAASVEELARAEEAGKGAEIDKEPEAVFESALECP